jgi:hypothetical protein
MAISVQPASATKLFALSISDTAAHPSAGFSILQYNYAGLQLNTTGTLVGAWTIQVSNDTGQTWSDITTGFTPSIAAVAASPSSQFAQCVPIVVQMIRVTFTATSGSGVASASICLRGSTN